MSEKRDYSEVRWPWEDDPHWAPPREGATSDPGDRDNWALECAACALRFPDDYTVGDMGAHWHAQHDPDGDLENPKPELNLVWMGLGTPPQPPENVLG